MLAISYITAHFLFASAKYLFTQNCKAPSGVEIFDGFSQSELKQDADLARRDLAKDTKIARRRAYAFDSLRLYHPAKRRAISANLFSVALISSADMPFSACFFDTGSVSRLKIPS